MTIEDVILNADKLNEDAVIYAKKIGGKFLSSFGIVILDLPEDDRDLLTKAIAEKYCREFEYFLEGFIVKEMVHDIRVVPEYKTLKQQVEGVIY